MTIEKLCELYKNNVRRLWYCYDGLFGSVALWKALYNLHESIRDSIVAQLNKANNLINMRIPLSVDLYVVPNTHLQRYQFMVSWDIFIPDICGKDILGIDLGIAENNENVFETYEECVEYCEKCNKNIVFNSDITETLQYINIIKKFLP